MKDIYLCKLCNQYTHVDIKYIHSFQDTIKVRCNFCNVNLSERTNINNTWDVETNCGSYIIESTNTLINPKFWVSSGDGEDEAPNMTVGARIISSLKKISQIQTKIAKKYAK